MNPTQQPTGTIQAGQSAYLNDLSRGVPVGTSSSFQQAGSIANTPVNMTPNASSLASAKPLSVPQSSVPQATASLGAFVNSANSTPPQGYQVNEFGQASPIEQPAQNDSKGILAKLKQGYDQLAGKSGYESQLNDQYGVDQRQQASIDTFNNYNSKRLQFSKMEQDYATQNNGISQGNSNKAFETLRRNNSYELANDLLSAQAAQGNYQGALDIIKRKVDSVFEPLQQNIENLTKFYELNQNDLSESQKFDLQTKIEEKKTEKKVKDDAYQSTLKTLAENGAPASVYASVDKAATDPNATAASIVAASGQYAQNILDRQVKEANIAQSKASAAASYASAAKSKKDSQVSSGALSSTTQAVIDNPNLINSLTATKKGEVIAQLQANGYDTTRLGAKALSDTAIAQIAGDETAIDSLNELKTAITGNEKYLGPISGFQALNPYSPAKVLQSKVDLVRQKVGKALEGGVLRKEDEEKYKKILTTLNDTPELSSAKIENLISTIQTGLDNYKILQTGAGKSSNVTGSLTKKSGETVGKTSTGNGYTITKE